MAAPNDMFFEDDASEEGLDLKRYVAVLLMRKWLILAIVVSISLPWLYYLKKLPPTYEAFCQIRFRNLERETADDMISFSRITELKSRSFAENVVAQLGLTLDMGKDKGHVLRQQFVEEFYTTKNPISGQYVFRWQNDGLYKLYRLFEGREILVDEGALVQAAMVPRTTDSGFTYRLASNFTGLPQEIPFRITQFRRAVESFQERTTIDNIGGNLLKVTMSDHDPALVAQMVNRLAEIYVQESRSLKKKSTEDKQKILRERLVHIKEDLDLSKEQLTNFRSTHSGNLDTETKAQLDERSKAEAEQKSCETAKNALQTLLDRIESQKSAGANQRDLKYTYRQLTLLSTFDSNPRMGTLKLELADLEDQYEKVVENYSENHARALELGNKIAEVHDKIKQEATHHLQELNRKIDILASRISNLDYRLKNQLPAAELNLAELERKYKANEELYNKVQAELQVAELTAAVETEDVDILDPALTPEYPVNRDKQKKAIMGIVLSLALGVGLALGLEFLDKSIKTVDDVKRFLRLDVIGAIPNIDFKDIHDYQDSEKIKQIDQQLVTYDYSPTPVGEAYRSLRTNLVFSKSTGRIQSFVITSTAPGDGKSFTAANVAISMAQHKSNTLLIDADLRRGVLHNTFGVPKEPGFTNYLTGMISLQHIINETLIPNLSMISCGSLLPNPSELLGSHQMKRFLDEAKRKFDMIIFDSPPLNAATDAIVIGTQVDAVVLVIRSGVTDRNIAKQKLEMFRNVPARLLGVILNGTTAEFGHDGYSYYHY